MKALLSILIFLGLGQRPPKNLDLNQAINQGAVLELIQYKGFTAKEYVKINSTWYINPEGTYYLFEYDEEKKQFIRRDQSIHHGATYGRFLFNYQNSIYSFGGAGMFTYHSNLIRFNFENSEWEEVQISGLNKKAQVSYATITGDSLLFVYEDLGIYSLGAINLKTRIFRPLKKYTNQASKFFIPLRIIRGNRLDYLHSDSWNSGMVFDKSKLEFLEADFILKEFSDSIFSSVFIGDSIIKIQNENHVSKETVYKVSIPELHIDDLEKRSMFNGMVSLILILTFITMLLILYIYNRKKVRNRDDQFLENQLDKLLYANELDEILDIKNYNYDTRRTIRSSKIKEINSKGLYKIYRSRDVNDKRLMTYIIRKINF